MHTNYEVAVINYPLMDPRIKPADHRAYMQLDYTNADPWDVPIYIHIPFCESLCKFCVYSRQIPDSEKLLDSYVQALKKEISLYAKTPYIRSLRHRAVFIGGGTPTVLSGAQLADIIATLKNSLPLKNPEITVECNISNTDEEKLQMLCEAGVTRISTGVQTFNQKLRYTLGLRHTVNTIFRWINTVKKYPFRDLSIDLLFGLPGQTIKEFEQDLHTALSLPIDHISVYKLAVFAYVKLYKELENGNVPALPEETQLFEMFSAAQELLQGNHYILESAQEYCIPDHKTKFWQLTYDGYGDNLSFGASSFGYVNGISYQNIIDPTDYIRAANEGTLPIHMVSHKITPQQLMERAMALGFRKGSVSKTTFNEQFDIQPEDKFGDTLQKLQQQEYILNGKTKYTLTPLGQYYQGNVSASFMQSAFENISPLKKKMAVGMHIIPEALQNEKAESDE